MATDLRGGGARPDVLTGINQLFRTLLAVALVGGLFWIGWRIDEAYFAEDESLRKKEAALADARSTIAEREQELADAMRRLSDKESEVSSLSQKVRAHGRTIAEQTKSLAAKEKKISEQSKTIADQEQAIRKLAAANRLLRVDHRMARLSVLEQEKDGETGTVRTKVQFVEVDDRGRAIDKPRTFEIVGDVVYVDYWIVKFDDQYIEEAVPLRSTSLCLFRRIFGEDQKPNEGYALDVQGERPSVYGREAAMTAFERRIWGDFWRLANQPRDAAKLGIRAAHGEAVSIKLKPAARYQLRLRASGGLSIRRIEGEQDVTPTT